LRLPYRNFDKAVVERLIGIDHISFWQFVIFRFASLSAPGMQNLCQPCVERTQRDILARIPHRRGIRSRLVTRVEAEMIFDNLYPYVAPDEELLDVVSEAAGKRSFHDMMSLAQLSISVHKLRTAQALSASLVVDAHDLEQPPDRTFNKTDLEKQTELKLNEFVRQGIAIKIPDNIPLEAYIELVREFRPAIRKVCAQLVESTRDRSGDVDLVDLVSRISDFNHELERVGRKRRYLVLEAIVGVLRRNRRLMKAILTTMGLGAMSGVADLTVRDGQGKGARGTNVESESGLKQRLLADVRPYVSKIAGMYLRTDAAAMHMLLVQRRIDRVSRASPARGSKVAQLEDPVHLH
jgi:hypothetical protein